MESMWNDIIKDVVVSVVGIILSALGTWLTYFISTKVKSEKEKAILNGAINIVSDGVKYVYQTYVEAIKGTPGWNKTTIKEANDKAIAYIKGNLSEQMITYLKSNGKDIET
jgi:type II secretory pathway pseudopilin PulG